MTASLLTSFQSLPGHLTCLGASGHFGGVDKEQVDIVCERDVEISLSIARILLKGEATDQVRTSRLL